MRPHAAGPGKGGVGGVFAPRAARRVGTSDKVPAERTLEDYFVCEPVGRLVCRASVRDVDGEIVLANRCVEREICTSTDMDFRPVWSATGPDGAL